MRDLVIFGAGGYGREVRQVVEDVNADASEWNLAGFLDGDPALHGQAVRDLPVLGGPEWLDGRGDVAVALAVGGPAGRRAVAERIGAARCATLVHPGAWIGNHVALGTGTIVLAGVTVSTDIAIGDLVCLNKNCIVGHDAVIGRYATISPGASISGYVRVGEGCDVGANSVIVQGHAVGDWSVVGAGAVVTKDLPAGVTAVGVPARVIKARDA
ncbi:MAG TPA: acetyltransferase [Solirubrobacteraceae bacterium]|jgi:sugar O-acyltransferase (sialic acid O-acetyltransferase NeuD family)